MVRGISRHGKKMPRLRRASGGMRDGTGREREGRRTPAVPPPPQQAAVHDPRLGLEVVHRGEVRADQDSEASPPLLRVEHARCEAAVVMGVELRGGDGLVSSSMDTISPCKLSPHRRPIPGKLFRGGHGRGGEARVVDTYGALVEILVPRRCS